MLSRTATDGVQGGHFCSDFKHRFKTIGKLPLIFTAIARQLDCDFSILPAPYPGLSPLSEWGLENTLGQCCRNTPGIELFPMVKIWFNPQSCEGKLATVKGFKS